MYMKVSEFRKDLKQAFDDALHGESVVIERGGVKYQLIADGIFPKVGPMPKNYVKTQDIKIVSEALGAATVPQANRYVTTPEGVFGPTPEPTRSRPLCKIHGIPLDARGRCLQKGCKYS